MKITVSSHAADCILCNTACYCHTQHTDHTGYMQKQPREHTVRFDTYNYLLL